MKIPCIQKILGTKICKDKNGFTLIEVLIVVFLLGLLGTLGLMSYSNSTRNFQYLDQYKKVISMLREGRSLAITNEAITNPVSGEKEVPSEFGVLIDEENKVIELFANNGSPAHAYEFVKEDDRPNPGDKGDTVLKKMKFENYQIEVNEDPDVEKSMILLWQTFGYGGVMACFLPCEDPSDEGLSKIVFSDPRSGNKREILVIHFSGIVEEIRN